MKQELHRLILIDWVRFQRLGCLVRKLWDPVIQKAEDAIKTAGLLLDDGMKFFRSKLGTLPLLSSETAFVGGVHDRTH